MKKTGKKHPIFPEQKVLVLCILMIDNNFKSLYYIVSYRTNYIYTWGLPLGYGLRQIPDGAGAAAIRTDAVPREKPAAFFKLEGMCEKDVFQ